MSLEKIIESKESKIRKLNLTDEQKDTLINLFNKYNYLESKIDWNDPNLTWDDFKEVTDIAGKSRSSQKKYGIEGLIEGRDYIYFGEGYNDTIGSYRMYRPLTYEGSRVLASNKVPPVKGNGAKWCISYQKTPKYWDNYTKRKMRFLFLLTEDTKYAVTLYPENFLERVEVYSFGDQNLGYADWCKQDKTITEVLSRLQAIKIIGLRQSLEFTENPDGTYDYRYKDVSERIQKYKKKGYEVYVKSSTPSSRALRDLIRSYVKDGEFTVQFNRWDSDFVCSNLSLTSLKGAPEYVGGSFDCENNNLSSLEGAPEYVEKDFLCCSNKLISLKGAPRHVGGRFFLNYPEPPEFKILGEAPRDVGSYWLRTSRDLNYVFLKCTPSQFIERYVIGTQGD